jgi:DHA2 family multidrug resistance protein
MAVATVSPVAETVHPSAHKWLVAMAVMLGAVLEVLDNTIVNVSLPHMQGAFSAGVDEIAWVATSYLVANGIMIPMTGWISSRFGRKRYFLFSVTMFVGASAACGLARSLQQMVVFRLIQGAAGAAMIPSSQAILMETFPPNEQALAMATWGVGLMVAPIMGPTLGGWITDNLSWRWNFYINVPVGILAALMVSAFVHDPAYLRQRRAAGGRVDYLGIAFLALGLGISQIVLDRGQRADWFQSTWVIWAACSAVGFLAALAIHELRFSEPILDLRILKHPQFTLAVSLVVLMSFVLFGTGLLNPIFLQEYLGYTAWQAGLVMAPRGLGTMVAMFTLGQLARAGWDTRPLIGGGFCMMAFGLWAMAHWTLQVDTWGVVWPSMILGLGMGLIFPTLSAATLSCVPRERMGFAASLYNMMRNTGAAVGISYLMSTLLNREQIHQSRLVEHFSIFEAWKLGHGAAQIPGAMLGSMLGMMTVNEPALGRIYGMIQSQAAMLSFNDIYRMLALVAILLAPSFFFLKRVEGPADSAVE